jgi:hypothetical protein
MSHPASESDLEPDLDVEADVEDPLNLVVYPDEPPKSGEWVDSEDALAEPTEEELEAGRLMGEQIEVENDDDTGVES